MFRHPRYLMFDAALTFLFRFRSYSQIRSNVHFLTISFSIVVDLCLADPGATMTFVAGGALKPIGGHILSHASATRLFLRKGDKNSTTVSSQADAVSLLDVFETNFRPGRGTGCKTCGQP